uniref:CAD protein n=1 Tax=Romanomermis culicivorax TaxID=13658 RepID=A0A915HUT8_ROMCU
ALKALREENVRTILINPNVATVQTSKGFADEIYFLPIMPEFVEQVIKSELPDGILLTFGGQTALNCGVELYKNGIFEKYGVEVLGTPVQTIEWTEDRKLFAEKLAEIGKPVAPCRSAETVEEVLVAGKELGYPVLIRSAFALGGLGSGFAHNDDELKQLAKQAFTTTRQVFVDKSLQGWKEIEYEVVRDAYDNCITVCNMENVDPLGIHTGESVVVAPSQTLSNEEYNMLRSAAIEIIRHLGVIGECNVQYALNPQSLQYYVIEVNARLSRSSALASKATGYPLAYVAAKIMLNQPLDVLRNSATNGRTTACFEPSLDYCVVKVPRWDLSKFLNVSRKIGSSMKSVGEAMGIGRCFEEAFQKALRMVDERAVGFTSAQNVNDIDEKELTVPHDRRMFSIATALKLGYSVEKLNKLTKIDPWFLNCMERIVSMEVEIEGELKDMSNISKILSSDKQEKIEDVKKILLHAKQLGFSDKHIAQCIGSSDIRSLRKFLGVTPFVKRIDTVAAEWPAGTNYFYLTYNGDEHDTDFAADTPPTEGKALQAMVLGSGVYRIGSSVEFDCCSVGCVRELKRLGYDTIMINCNPETVSTDYDICDRLYFEEVSFEAVMDIHELERPEGVVLCMGGQLPNNIAVALDRNTVKIFGTSPEQIDTAENRYKFSRMLDDLNSKKPQSERVHQPRWRELTNFKEAKEFCAEVGYPCLVRPSYVLSGAAMNVAHDDTDLESYLEQASVVSKDYPVVISKFILEAKEIDVDVVAADGRIVCLAICEHVENAGIHSGDATMVTPPQDLTQKTTDEILRIVRKIAKALRVTGPFNIQLIAKDDILYVIECNLRVSRSFPFISKALNYDFVAAATKVLVGEKVEPKEVYRGFDNKIAVKAAQFSFSRLPGAEVILRVEMSSTGEVACFGLSRVEAYFKALLSTGFRIPEKNIFLSIGSPKQKEEMLSSIRHLRALGFTLSASPGTADYYRQNNVEISSVEWPIEEGGPLITTNGQSNKSRSIVNDLINKDIDLVINLPMRNVGVFKVSTIVTNGYKTRRMVVECGIPLITDIKCAKLLVEALVKFERKLPPVNLQIDRLSGRNIVRLPGLIDVHVHVREPGGEHKETWKTCTQAALSGGITMILAMPNTQPSLVDRKTYELVDNLAKNQSFCDYGLYLGATSTNFDQLPTIARKSVGLKMYLNETYSTLKLDSVLSWCEHFKHWPAQLPIVCHAEGATLAAVLGLVGIYKRPIHFCHVSTKEENINFLLSQITLVAEAKKCGLPVTCEVAPHHLFLTRENFPLDSKLSGVRPALGTEIDRSALWENLDSIDCFATDHAPHLLEEKLSEKSPPGFPGLETMLPLLLTAVKDGKLTMEDVVKRLHHNPRRIFKLPEQSNTYVEVDLDEKYNIPQNTPFCKSKWTPFAGLEVFGRVRRVVLRGEEVYIDGKFPLSPGYGKNVKYLAETLSYTTTASLIEPATILTNGHGLEIGQVTPVPLPDYQMNGDAYDKDSTIGLSRPLSRTALTCTPTLKARSRTTSSVFIPEDITLHGHLITKYNHQLTGCSILQASQMNRDTLHYIFHIAEIFRHCVKAKKSLNNILLDHTMVSLFYEVSTRTAKSFEAAMKKLGGSVIEVDSQTSSVQKGETLEDTVKILSTYGDIVVLRHPEPGAAKRASIACKRPIINAGDGTGEHPTQAMLDIFTIRDEIGTVNGLTITLVGDLKHGRTVHSLARMLACYRVTLRYVSPKGLEMPDHVVKELNELGVLDFKQEYFDNLEDALPETDVLYMTRIQKERFHDLNYYNQCCDKFVVTPRLMQFAKSNKMIVLHPLPRVNEISPEFDSDPRAAYFRQAENGLYVRMAILAIVAGKL